MEQIKGRDLTQDLAKIDRFRGLLEMTGDEERLNQNKIEINSGLKSSVHWSRGTDYSPLCNVHFFMMHHLGPENSAIKADETRALHEGLTQGIYEVFEERLGAEFVSAVKRYKPSSEGRNLCEMVKVTGTKGFAQLVFKASIANRK